MQGTKKQFLCTSVMCCALLIGWALPCMAIDSTSTLEPEMVKLNNENVGIVDNGNEKRINRHLTANSSKTKFPDVSMSDVCLHEGTVETARISKNVINWISASETILGIRYDKEVGDFVADYDGKNCYLRYSGPKILVYINTETAVYPTWLVPSDLSAVHIELKKNNPIVVNGNESLGGQRGTTASNNKETQLIEMVKFAYASETEQIAVAKLQRLNVINGVQGYRYKSIKFDGGMYVQVYLFRLDPLSVDESVDIKETDFLLPELCYYPIGVSLESHDLKKDRFTRVFVVGAEKPMEDDNENQ